MSHETLINGERVEALIQVFSYLKTNKQRDGMVKVTSDPIPNAVMAPFLRALMRREARLLREDADCVDDQTIEPRTYDQRRADAFCDLVASIDAVTRYMGSAGNRPDEEPPSPVVVLRV